MKRILGIGLLVFMAGLFLGALLLKYDLTKERKLQENIAQKVLRFHVLANSDSQTDQKVKLAVRDAVGGYLAPYLSEAMSKEESKQVIAAHKKEIEQIADDVIAKAGLSYTSSAQIQWTDFPQKTYGEYTFPKGEYEALEISLGKAKGHNWWCVLYPNMCFAGSVYEVVEEESKTALEEVLTVEEYKEILEGGDYEIRLKFLELFDWRD